MVTGTENKGWRKMMIFFLLLIQCSFIATKEDVHVLVLIPDLENDPYCYRAAIEIANDVIDTHPRLLPNHRLIFHYRDTERKRGKALDAVYQIRRNLPPVHFIIGPVEKIIVKDIFTLLVYMKINQFTFGTNMKEIYDYHNQNNRHLHHYMAPQDYSFARVKTKLIQYFNWSRAAIIYDHSLSSSSDHLTNEWKAHNVTLITKQDYIGGNIEQISQKLSNLQEKDSRIIVGEFNENIGDVMCEVYNKGLYAPRIVWVLRRRFDENWATGHKKCTLDQLKEAADGHFAFDFLQIRRDNNVTGSNMTATQFIEALQKRRNNLTVNFAASYAFDSLWMAVTVLQQSIDDPSIRNTSDHRYRDHRTANTISSLVRTTSFEGLSGHVQFENLKRHYYDRENDIVIYQYRKGLYHEIGMFNSIEKEIFFHSDEEKKLFQGNRVPKDKMTVIRVLKSYDTNVILTVVILTACCIILSLFFLFVNIRYDSHTVIRMSSPDVNNVIICGSILCYLTVILNGLDQSVVARSSVTWVSRASDILLALGFTLGFGGFFAKTWRVYKIFTASAKLKKVKMLSTSMFLLLTFFAIVDVALFTCWYSLSDVSITEKELSRIENILEDSITINYYEETAIENQPEFYAAFLGYKGLMLVFGLFLAWQTRNVSIDVLNDSKFIGLAVYNVSAISVVGVVSITALKGSNNPQLIYIVSALCVVLSTMVSMLLVFLPKVLLVFSKHQDLHSRTKSRFQRDTSASVYNTEMSTIDR